MFDPYLSSTYLISTFCLQTTLPTSPPSWSKPPSSHMDYCTRILTSLLVYSEANYSQHSSQSVLDKLKSDPSLLDLKLHMTYSTQSRAGPKLQYEEGPSRSLASSLSAQPPNKTIQPHCSPYSLNTARKLSSWGLCSNCLSSSSNV